VDVGAANGAVCCSLLQSTVDLGAANVAAVDVSAANIDVAFTRVNTHAAVHVGAAKAVDVAITGVNTHSSHV